MANGDFNLLFISPTRSFEIQFQEQFNSSRDTVLIEGRNYALVGEYSKIEWLRGKIPNLKSITLEDFENRICFLGVTDIQTKSTSKTTSISFNRFTKFTREPSFLAYRINLNDVEYSVVDAESENQMISHFSEQINTHHCVIKVGGQLPYPSDFASGLVLAHAKRVYELFEKHFDIFEDHYGWKGDLFLCPKRKEVNRENNTSKITYVNGVEEIFTEWFREFHGKRTFPDGTVEKGRFTFIERELYSGYILKNGKHIFIGPNLKSGGCTEPTDIGLADIKINGKRALILIQKNLDETGGWVVYQGIPQLGLLELAQKITHPFFESIFNHSQNTFDFKDFIYFLLASNQSSQAIPPIFSLPVLSLKEILAISKKLGMKINLETLNPENGKTLSLHLVEQLDIELLEWVMLESKENIYHLLNQQNIIAGLILSLNSKFNKLIHWFIENTKTLDLSIENKWMILAYQGEDIDLAHLPPELKQNVYKVANTYGHRKWVKYLNAHGMQVGVSDLEVIKKPAILSSNMDLICVRKKLKWFLIDLRKNQLLLTQDEFKKLEKNWISKGSDFGRILGRNHVEHIAKHFDFRSIMVPKKIAVIKHKQTTIEITVKDDFALLCRDFEIYAQVIQESKRLLSRKEMTEVYLTIKLTDFNDVNRGNFFIADNGVYFIDTEYRNFFLREVTSGELDLLYMVSQEDQEWLSDVINGKDEEFNAKYKSLRTQLTIIDQKQTEDNLVNFGFSYRTKPFIFKTESILKRES